MAVGPARARECRPKRSLSWAVMVGGSGSRTGSRAYAALMLQSKSGICCRNSPNEPSVRDRGVGGSNPLAPTNKISRHATKGPGNRAFCLYARSCWEVPERVTRLFIDAEVRDAERRRQPSKEHRGGSVCGEKRGRAHVSARGRGPGNSTKSLVDEAARDRQSEPHHERYDAREREQRPRTGGLRQCPGRRSR